MSISIEQLETALASNDVATAEQILLDYFGKEPLTQKEQGQATVEFAMQYMQLVNQLNQDYLEALQDTVAVLLQNQKAQSKLIDSVDLKEARAKLQ